MNAKEKTNVIDTMENRLALSKKIAHEVLVQNQIEDETDVLYGWLVDNISSDSLYDIINNEQKLYVVKLAKKVAADICYMEQVSDYEHFYNAAVKYGDLGNFVIGVILTNDINGINDFMAEVSNVSNVIGYEDTMIVNDTAYIYDNGENEDKNCYTATLEIGYHKNYTCNNLHTRIEKRMNHKWHDKEIKLIEVVKNENNTFTAKVTFFCEDELEDVLEKMNYRFGKESGRPWHRSKVAKVEKN